MANSVRFFLTYEELCKTFSSVALEDMYYLDLRVDRKSRYIGNIYTQFHDIPELDNCMHINIEIALLNQNIKLNVDKGFPANILVNKIERQLTDEGMFVILKQNPHTVYNQDDKILREYEIYISSHQNISSKKMYKKLQVYLETSCISKMGFYFGKETYDQRTKWIFEPYLTGLNYFTLNEDEEYIVWYRDSYVRKIMGMSYEKKMDYLKSICDLSKKIEDINKEQSAILHVINSFYKQDYVKIKDILVLFNDKCCLFSGWSLMDKCFDLLISVIESKGSKGFKQLIENLNYISERGYNCGLCKILTYCLNKKNKTKFLGEISYLSTTNKQVLISQLQIMHSKKLQKEIENIMYILEKNDSFESIN